MSLDNYETRLVLMSEIWADPEFNCRGIIAPMDVADLAKDIDEHELQFPISIQPIEDTESTPLGGVFKYRLVAGHRRHKAFQMLRRTEIPAMIKSGLTEIQARVYNLSENLQRKELNILQEANALAKLKALGLGQEAAGKALGRTRSWAQVRYNLLELPEVIREEAAAGLLNQSQIKQLYSLGSNNERYEAVRRIKDAKLKGEGSISVAKPPELDPYKKKRRQKNEIQDMIRHVGREGSGYGLATRCMAWCNGEISTAELYGDIEKACRENGKQYNIPVAFLRRHKEPVS